MKNLLISLLLVPFLFACGPVEKKGADLTGKVLISINRVM